MIVSRLKVLFLKYFLRRRIEVVNCINDKFMICFWKIMRFEWSSIVLMVVLYYYPGSNIHIVGFQRSY